MINNKGLVGLGNSKFSIGVYIANRPPLPEYQHLTQVIPLTSGEITAIGQQCGNGWRKVFNVYAKLLFALDKDDYNFSSQAATWQAYRDQYLLQPEDGNALLFSYPLFEAKPLVKQAAQGQNVMPIHIIMGRTYAKSLVSNGYIIEPLTWLDEEFAINTTLRVIVCPYFDYRQLSNSKIERLAGIIKGLNS